MEHTTHDLIANIREKGTELIPLLEKEGITVRFVPLRVVDFMIAGRMAIIRRTADEFASDLKTKMVYRNLIEFKRQYREPLYIIEGKEMANNGTPLTAIRSGITYITAVNRVPIIFTSSIEETSKYLSLLVKQSEYTAHGEETPAETASGGEGETEPEEKPLPLQVLTSFPGIDQNRAEALLKKFGSLKGICSATVQELQTVKGIGAKRARQLKETMEAVSEP